ncbi:MAG TPA: sigma-70 family RNA polymerase sigma factor [Vicinamibacterales bacterium]
MSNMADHERLAERFERNRGHLRAVAYRLLGSVNDAEDAVQETWLRLNRSDAREIANLDAWLTTVVSRVCLDMLRSSRLQREELTEDPVPEESIDAGGDPERDAVIADSISSALLVVLETLAPAERVAFVLHDMFDLQFDDIGPIVGRSSEAARQLASRARRRVRGASVDADRDRGRNREIVDAFLAASRGGDFAALVALLDPHVVLSADAPAVEAAAARQAKGAPKLAPETRGASDVAHVFAGRAKGAQPALLDGTVGAVWVHGGQPLGAFRFAVADGKIARIDIITERSALQQLEIKMLE